MDNHYCQHISYTWFHSTTSQLYHTRWPWFYHRLTVQRSISVFMLLVQVVQVYPIPLHRLYMYVGSISSTYSNPCNHPSILAVITIVLHCIFELPLTSNITLTQNSYSKPSDTFFFMCFVIRVGGWVKMTAHGCITAISSYS